MAVEAWHGALILGFLTDLVVGDPQFRHHPVRYMGKTIDSLEPAFRRLPLPLVLSGGIMAVLLILSTWAFTHIVLTLSGMISYALQTGIHVAIVYFCLACRGLEQSAMAVHGALRMDRLETAREKLALIVGRDVRSLSETGVATAAVETVAENLVDGVVAPIFFYAVAGPAGMMAYKMINTLDSMIGYRNDTYIRFGKVAARIDDAAGFIPARISVLLIALSAWVLSGRGQAAWALAVRDGRRHKSPNSGFPEAAFAGVLRVKLGGPNIYHGQMVEKPYIGEAFNPARVDHIPMACDLMMMSSLWAVLFSGLPVWGVNGFFLLTGS